MRDFHRSTVLISIFALMLAACASDPQPQPVAQSAPVVKSVAPAAPAAAEFVSSGTWPNAERIPATMESASESLRAAAIRNIFSHKFASDDLAQAKVYFVAVGPNDKQLTNPSDSLVSELLKDAKTPFKKFSECVVDEGGVRDTASGARGVLFRVCRLCWTSPNSALLEYGYTTRGFHGMQITAEALLSGGTWSFTMRKMSLM